MAWTITARGQSTGYGLGSGGDVGNAFVPAAGSVIVVACYIWDLVTVSTLTAANWNLTAGFSQIGSTLDNGAEAISVYAGIVGASPTSDSVTVTTDSDTSYNIMVMEIDETDLETTLANIFPQSVQESSYNGGTGNQIGATMSAYQDADNMCLKFLACQATAQTYTLQTGFTSLMSSNAQWFFEATYKITAETAPTMSPVDVNETDGGMAFEVAGNIGGGGGSDTLFLGNGSNNLQGLIQR